MAIFLQEDQFSKINLLKESISTGTNRYIEGPFLMANKYNRNGRIYPKDILDEAYSNYDKNYIKEQRAIGEFEHPERPFPDPKKAAILIKEMGWKDDNLHGKAQLLTDMGSNSDAVKIAALMDAGFKMGVSSRGLGEVKLIGENKVEVMPGFEFFAVDVVDRPSGQNCYVNQLFESEMNQWIKKDGKWLIDTGENKLQEKSKSELIDEKELISMFEKFLGNLI